MLIIKSILINVYYLTSFEINGLIIIYTHTHINERHGYNKEVKLQTQLMDGAYSLIEAKYYSLAADTGWEVSDGSKQDIPVRYLFRGFDGIAGIF